MGTLLNFGQVVADLNIQRADVSVGHVGYCVLLDTRVMAKQVVFVDKFGFVEVTQEDVICMGKQPILYYLMLAVRLNTDPQGRVYGDDITVEYLRMSRGQYKDFTQSVTANPTASAVMLTKERRVNASGKDVSCVKLMAAQLELSPAIKQKIELLKANPATVEGLFVQVDSIMGAPMSKYEEWLAQQRAGGVAPVNGGGVPVGGGYGSAASLPPQQGVSSAPVHGAAPQPYGGGGVSASQPYGGASMGYVAPSQSQPQSQPQSQGYVGSVGVMPPEEMGFGGDPFDAGFDGQGGF